MMKKKLLLISLSALFLSACADKESYQQAILADMENDSELKDYNISPEDMSVCVVDLSSRKMPGLFKFDPARLSSYQHYAKMVSLTKSKDPSKALAELTTDFGSPKALMEARTNYTESIAECFASAVMKSEPPEDDKKPS